MNASSCSRLILYPTCLPLVPIPYLRRLQPPFHSQTSQTMFWMLHLIHRCQFMGEMGLLHLICPLFLTSRLQASLQCLLTHRHLHPSIIHFLLHLHRLQPLQLAILITPLLPLVLSVPSVPEMSGCRSNGPFQIATSSQGNQHQQLSLQTKMMTQMIPWTSSKLV